MRRQRWTALQIAEAVQLGSSTIARLLGRLRLARLRQLTPLRPPSATSKSGRASAARRRQKSWPGSAASAIASRGIGAGGCTASGASISTSLSMTACGWRKAKYCLPKASPQPPRFCAARWRASAGAACSCSASSLTTVTALARACLRTPAARLRWPISAPVPIPRAPTARRNDLSGRCSGSGHTCGVQHLTSTDRARAPLAALLHLRRRHSSVGDRPPITRVAIGDNLVRLHN